MSCTFAEGDWVIYRPYPGAPAEDGEVTEIRGDLVMVLYRGDRTAKATRAADLAPGRPTLPLHRTEAGWPNCSTCDGGGCPDCTDPA